MNYDMNMIKYRKNGFFRIAAAISEQQESWKDSGSRKGRKHDRKN